MARWIRILLVPTFAWAGVIGASVLGTAGASKTVTLTPVEEVPNKPVKLGPEDRLEIRLSQTPGTGFSWYEASDSTKLLKQESKREESVPRTEKDGKVVGGASYLVVVFKVREGASSHESKGEQMLKMVLRRPGGKPRATVTVPIELKD